MAGGLEGPGGGVPELSLEGCRIHLKCSIFLINKEACVFSVENVSTWVFCPSVFYKICIYIIIGIKLYLLFSNLPLHLILCQDHFPTIKHCSGM